MNALKLAAFACIVPFALSAQSPAPQAPSASAKPLRHLEYAFQADYTTNGEGHGSGMDAGGEGGVSSGVHSMLGGGGRRGTMAVDVLGLAPDGALVVVVNEMLQEAPRPGERFTCTIYGDGHVLCPTADGPLTDAENLLLSLLGRGFIDATVSDSNKHWRRTYDGKQVSVVTDYTIANVGDGGRVTIVKHSTITSRTRSIGDSVEDGKIVYDTTLSVPDTVADTVYETYHDRSLQSTFDLTLKSDTFAQPAH
ncbi:MAG TPA: hypothetical protein VGF86_09195 [Candidatus Tumulicola sp.]|jgi:hypothetical protein